MRTLRNLKVTTIGIIGVVGAYTLSYCALSRNGHYEPVMYGLLQGRNGGAVLAPKAAFGYRWLPFSLTTKGGDPTWIAWIYYPMIQIDWAIWHTQRKMDTFQYPVKIYFDYETQTYPDIVPQKS